MSNVAVIYYSATGNVHALAEAIAEGAAGAGAEVRLRRVPDLADAAAIDANPAWRSHADAVAATIAEAQHEDLEWADAYAFGTPSRYGTPAAQLKHFLDGTAELWGKGVMADKPVTAFTSAHNVHGGAEATILSLSNVFHHWGSILVPPGYTDRSVYAAGGNPYGASAVSGGAPDVPSAETLAAARFQGERLAAIAARLAAGARAHASEVS